MHTPAHALLQANTADREAPAKKKKKKDLFSPGEAAQAASTSVREAPASPVEGNIAAAERGSQGTLPTSFVYGIASASTDDKEAARAAALVAREMDFLSVPPEMIKQLRGRYTDPATGQSVISLQKARNMVIASVLAKHFEKLNKKGVQVAARPIPTREGGFKTTARKRLDPAVIQSYMDALAPLPGKISFADAVGIGATLAADEVPVGLFRNSLQTIKDWNGDQGPLNEQQMVGLAHAWSLDHDRAMTDRDVGAVMYPGLNNTRSYLEEQVAAKGAEAQAASALTQVAGTILAGSIRGMGGAIALPSPEAAEEMKQAQVALNTVRRGMESFTPRYFKMARAVQADLAAEEAGRQDNWFTRTMGSMLYGLDRAFQTVMGAVYTVVGPLAKAAEPVVMGATGQGEKIPDVGEYFQGIVDAGRDGIRMVMGRQRFGDTVAEESGFQPGTTSHKVVSLGSEFLAGWFLDPLVLAGSARKALGLRRLVSPAGEFSAARTTSGLLDPEAVSGVGTITPFNLRAFKGTGPFRRLVDPEGSISRFQAAINRTVPGRWTRPLGIEGKHTLPSFLAHALPKDLDGTIERMRGLYGLGPGLDRFTGSFISDWVTSVRRGVVDDRTVGEVQDILFVSAGAKSATEAGDAFRRVIDTEIPAATRRALAVMRQAQQVTPLQAGTIIGQATGQTDGLTGAALREMRETLGQDLLNAVPDQPTLVRRLDDLTQDLAARQGAFSYRDGMKLLEGRQRVIPGVPKVSWLPSTRDIRLGITRSTYWRSKSASWLRSFSEMRPGGSVNIEDAFSDETFARWLREFGTLPEEQIGVLRGEYIRLARFRTAEREQQWERFIRGTIDRAYASMGLPPKVVEGIVDSAMRNYSQASRAVNRWMGSQERVYSIVKRGTKEVRETVPVYESQLLNTLVLPDPLLVKASVREAVGSIPRLTRRSEELFGKLPEQLSDEQWVQLLAKQPIDQWLKRESRDVVNLVGEKFLSIWKPWVLLRPSWTIRVVLLDENLRSLVALQSMMDRVLGVAGPAKLARRLGVAERHITIPGIGDVPLGRLPGLIDDEAAASSIKSTREIQVSGVKREAQLAKTLDGLGDKVVQPGARNHLAEWTRALNRVVAQSPLGRRALHRLAGIPDAKGVQWTEERLVKWLSTDRRAGLSLQRATNKTPEEIVQDAIGGVESLTAGRPEIALAVLNNHADARFLSAAIPDVAGRPAVVGDAMENITGLTASWPRRQVDRAFHIFSRYPTERLSRQPFFKNMYVRERERLLGLARQRAGRGGVDEQALARIDNLAKEHGIMETRRVMYSLTERSRFAEAQRFIMPFYAPWQESFTVWGRLLWENPRAIGHMRLVARAAADTGVIRQNEDGDWVAPSNLWLGAGPILNAITGGRMGKGFSVWQPLESVNLFMSGAMPVPIGGADIPLPLPGFSPLAQEFVNEAIRALPDNWQVKARLLAWATQYGPEVEYVPAPWQRMLTAAFPDLFKSSELTSITNHFTDVAAAYGEELSPERAQNQARMFLAARALFGWTMAAAPGIDFPTEGLRDEVRGLITEVGFNRAADILKERYPNRPDMLLLAFGHTVLGEEQAQIPLNELSARLFQLPEFREVLRGPFKELAFALIPSELREGEFGEEAQRLYMQQIADGIRMPRTPQARVAALENTQAWDRYFAATAQHDAMMARHGIDPDSLEARVLKEKFLNPELRQIVEDFPGWSRSYDAVTGGRDPVIQDRISLLANMLEASPLLRDTELGQGAQAWIDLWRPIKQRMAELDLSSLDSSLARDLGIAKEWREGIKDIRKRFPDMGIVLDDWNLDNPFAVIVTEGEKFLAELPKKWVVGKWIPWVERMNAIDEQLNTTIVGPESSELFLEQRRLYLQAEAVEEATGFNPAEVTWNVMSGAEKRVKKVQTATKFYVFLTPFERRTVLGLDTSDAAEQGWLEANELWTQTERQIQNARLGMKETGHLYEARDRAIAQIAARNADFAKEWERSQTWGFALFHVMKNAPEFEGWREKNSPEGQGWEAIEGGVQAIQRVMTQYKVNSYDDYYEKVKLDFEAYIQEWIRYSPDLAEHWRFADNTYFRGQLLDALVPDVFFPTEKSSMPVKIPVAGPDRFKGAELGRGHLEWRLVEGKKPLTVFIEPDSSIGRDLVKKSIGWINDQVGGRVIKLTNDAANADVRMRDMERGEHPGWAGWALGQGVKPPGKANEVAIQPSYFRLLRDKFAPPRQNRVLSVQGPEDGYYTVEWTFGERGQARGVTAVKLTEAEAAVAQGKTWAEAPGVLKRQVRARLEEERRELGERRRYVHNPDDAVDLIAHELLHTLSLGHATLPKGFANRPRGAIGGSPPVFMQDAPNMSVAEKQAVRKFMGLERVRVIAGDVQEAGTSHMGNRPLLKWGNATLAKRAMWALLRASEDFGSPIQVTDSYRDRATQAGAYARKPGLVAPPGSSLHEEGLAIDVNGDVYGGYASQRYQRLSAALQKAGWHQFDPEIEPWHWSYGEVG